MEHDKEFNMAKGIVKWYDENKEYGFITSDECDNDIFVHKNDIEQVLIDGQHVEFDLEIGGKGPKARNVKVVPKEV